MGEGKQGSQARVIYRARLVKESKQKEESSGNEIQHPYDDEKGNLISYYNTLPKLNAYHSRSISVKAACTVNLGFKVTEGSEKEITERLEVVNDEGESFIDVIGRVALDFETTANGYLECVRGKGGRIEELYFCPAIKTYRRPRGSDTAFLYRGDGEAVKYHKLNIEKPEEHSLIHFRQLTQANRHYGLPDWTGIIPEIELDYYSNLYAQGFFLNSGVPDLAIVVEGGEFDKDTEKAVVEFVQQNFKGVTNAHRTLYLPINDEGVKVRFEKLAPSNSWAYPIDKMRESSRDRILSAHGVPPRLAGVVTAGQLGGGSEVFGQLSVFQETTIGPRQRIFVSKINPLLKAMGISGKIELESINTSEVTESEADNKGTAASLEEDDQDKDPEAVKKSNDKQLLKTLEDVRDRL